MKKFLPLLLVVFFLIPFSIVFANENEIEPLSSGVIPNITPNNLISNIQSSNYIDFTFPYLLDGSPLFPYNKHFIIYELPKLTSFLNVKINKDDKILNVMGYDVDFKLVENNNNLSENNLSFDFSEDVKYVVLVSYSAQNPTTINSINFYGLSNYLPVKNLSESNTFNSINLVWDNPDSEGFKNIIIKQNGIEVAELGAVKSYSITGLTPETTYNFEVIAKYSDGTLSDPEKITVTTDEQPDDILAPDDITGLSVSVTSFDATFAWVNPPDTDFKHVRIYRDGELIEPSHTQNTYNATGLVPNTTYVFKFVTVDANGNNSTGYIQSIKTNPELDNIAPDTVIGLSIYNGNKSGQVKWTSNNENDLAFYNVYVNGVKHNESPVLSTNYVINNIENDITYEINVTAVDTSGNESGFSSSGFLTPEESAMPVFKASYDLKSVSDGTSNWFGSMWPILAFAVGLPLAFIVASRMKTLFFA